MPRVRANGVELEYDVRGDGPRTALLIMGLGRQMTAWPRDFLDLLVGAGLRVIRFDNRDVGLSSRHPERFSLMEFLGRRQIDPTAAPPYALDDMAEDAAALLEALEVERAHLVGVSLGGMIAQILAARRPDRIASLCSIMSHTSNPELPPATAEAAAVLFRPPPDPNDIDAVAEHGLAGWRVIGSPAYPADEAVLRERIAADARRAYDPQGVARQLAAALTAPDRRPLLATVAVPTLVIHGTEDPLVRVEGGRDTAAAVPGAELLEFPGMGHDLPAALLAPMVEAIMRNIDRAEPVASQKAATGGY